jgi:polar amino acid transport system substrate-binding protein
MTATPERARELGFLEYFQAGTSILVASGNPGRIGSMADLCGHTVTLQAGTIHEELVAAQQARCGARRIKGRPPESGTQVVLEVKFGRADAALADFPVAAYNAKVSGQGHDFQVVGEQIDPGPTASACPRTTPSSGRSSRRPCARSSPTAATTASSPGGT